MNRKRLLSITLVICSILFFVISFAQYTRADTNTVNSSSLNWEDANQLTSGGFGSIRPAVATSSDGRTVFVAHMRKTGVDVEEADPYYSRSNDYGKNWLLNPLPIRESSSDSAFIDVAIDASGNGHAVWTENNKELWYRPEADWGAGAGDNDKLSEAFVSIVSPKIATYSSSTLNLVWSHTKITGNDIFFARSTDGGNNWPTLDVNISNADDGESTAPDIAVDSSGTIHVVWQLAVNVNNTVILYANNTNNGYADINWSTPITISDVIPITGIVNLNQPSIHVQGSTVHISFENRAAQDEQNAYYVSCNSNCTNINNWSGTKVSTQDYSVKDSDPAYLSSEIVFSGSCPVVFFSSMDLTSGDNDEHIRTGSGCEGWANNTLVPSVEATLGTNRRAILPSATTANGWFIYLAYERKDNSTSNIFVTRNIPGLYLPVILKN